MTELPLALLVTPDDVDEESWVVRRLLEIAHSRWRVKLKPKRIPISADKISPTQSELLLSASFVLHDDPPWQYFCNLASSGRAVFFEEIGTGHVLAAGFPPDSDPALVTAWTGYLSFSSAGLPAERPPLPPGSWVLNESGSVSDTGFAPETHIQDDMRRARNLPAINRLVRELSRFSENPEILSREMARGRPGSLVPWLLNSMLNEIEYRRRVDFLESVPREFHISTTSACNIECRFCSYMHNKAIFRYLDLESFLRLDVYGWIENLRLSSGLGEPTLNPSLPAILDHLGTHYPHLNLNLFTNGLAWRRPGLLEAFGHLSWINVSLNASTAETWQDLCLKDGFGRVLSNLARLRESKKDSARLLPRIHASTVLNSRNLHELADLPYLCAEAGIVRLTAIPFFALGYSHDRKLRGDSSLDACKYEYAQVFERAVMAAEAAGVSLEAPSPGPAAKVAYGVQERSIYDFAKVSRAGIQIERLLPDSTMPGTACASLWRMSAIASTSLDHRRHDVHGYLYPCLGPLASHDFSVEMPIDYSGREQFMGVWNGPRYRRLRAGQSERGLSPTCDTCATSDSRDPRNFALLLELRRESASQPLVQLTVPA